ncbi:MAG: FAD-dependent oxidoreductase, partial [Candidatus Omnitrophica bacterium]|nr:FAD-dependent oxidoreductase [Candidatus Omnitrophota bacterium]
QRVFAKRRTLDYDYLLIASGSETNFYNNADIQRRALTLGSVDDVKRIRQTLNQGNFGNFIICGGGYTGIEIASNLRIYLNKLGKKGNIIIVEQAPAILGQLPQWMKDYVMINLKELKIEVYVNNVVGKTEGQRVILSGGMVFDKAMVIWAAGVRTAAFIQELKLEKNPQGRIRVDDYLRIDARCFAAGDAALFIYKGAPLRMAVQFAISQGECAALNIINSINGLPLRRFIPRDLGYIIPVANNRSCGTVLGADLKGRLPTLLHFVMCIYRSYGIKNRLGILSQLIGGCL